MIIPPDEQYHLDAGVPAIGTSPAHDPSITGPQVLASPLRLAAVAKSGLLDSPPDDAFDALTRLASRLLDAPASFVSIVDADRDFYKSQHGFAEPLASARQLSGPTFCHHSIAADGPLAITDTHADSKWLAVPTVRTLGVRAYVGVPLRLDGQAIGSFCAIDSRPRDWTALQVETLSQLAAAAQSQISLALALRAAEALARRHQQLLGVVAHDLRTPLQVLAISTDVLHASAPGPLLGSTLNRMRTSIDLMSRLVDDLLVIDSADGVPHQLIAAARLLAGTADTLQAMVARAGLTLAVEPVPGDLTVRIDYAELLRVLCNLVGNCVKYCPAGSTVRLRALADGGEVCLVVADDGPGIAADELPRVFDRGWQGQLGRDGKHGRGLGLYIVQELVARNGGRVAVDSQPGQGTTVTVRLPSR